MATKRFDLEQAIILYAYKHVLLPAKEIYSDDLSATLNGQERNCNIYLIGKCPKVKLATVQLSGDLLLCSFEALGQSHTLELPLPGPMSLVETEGSFHLENEKGDKLAPKMEALLSMLADRTNFCNFEVLYVGQAYGKDGSRNAVDRLKKHETLQKISLTQQDEQYYINTILLDILSNQAILTSINPWAKENRKSENRFVRAYDLLKEMNAGQLVTIYEAALIRYFEPKFNMVFKDSFPSTELGILKECYRDDINAVVAEINFERFAFKLYSDKIEASKSVTALFNLHLDADRRLFFGLT